MFVFGVFFTDELSSPHDVGNDSSTAVQLDTAAWTFLNKPAWYWAADCLATDTYVSESTTGKLPILAKALLNLAQQTSVIASRTSSPCVWDTATRRILGHYLRVAVLIHSAPSWPQRWAYSCCVITLWHRIMRCVFTGLSLAQIQIYVGSAEYSGHCTAVVR